MKIVAVSEIFAGQIRVAMPPDLSAVVARPEEDEAAVAAHSILADR